MDAKLTQFVQQMRLDVDALPDANVRSVVSQVFNLVEEVIHDNDRLSAENARLRECIQKQKQKLKGGSSGALPSAGASPAPATPPPTAPATPPGNRSSEQERRSREGKKKPGADGRSFRAIHVDRDVLCPVDRTILPPDATFVGYEDVVVQELIVKADNVRYRREIWHSSSGTLVGPLPLDVHGQFGDRLRALLVSLKYVAGASLPRAQELVEHFGIVISPASVVNILHDAAARLGPEKEDLFRAGLAATTYQHIDDTSARVGGEFWHTHLIGNSLHASYFTRRNKDRLTVLDLLRGGSRTYRFDPLTQRLLRELHVPRKWRRRAEELPPDRDLGEEELQTLLEAWAPPPPLAYREALREAAAIASYRARPDHVRILISDDAKQFRHLADESALCWIHEGRHYKELSPIVPCHQQQLEAFLKRYWDYYGELQTYQVAPTTTTAERLHTEFDRLFTTTTGYEELDRRIATTRKKKGPLMTVLGHPETPLHNNPAELDARVAARRRDVSLHCRHARGAEEMDTFTTIVQTAKKLLVNGYEYLYDRISGAMRLPSLAHLIRARSPPSAASQPPATPSPATP